jgi:nitronate monooxygenase
VPVVQLSFGDPRPFAETIHGHGAMLICQVQSDDEVDTAVEAGADVIIAQGRDAGGHGRPDRGTIALVPSVVDRVHPTPVVAAGGIADGRGLAAALMLGAGGVSIGTRLLASNEALSSRAEADAILASRAQDTVRTSVFDVIRGPSWPDGHDGRAIRNDLVDRWHHRIDEAIYHRRDLWLAYQAAPSDDYTKRALWAGEGLDLINSIEPAATIVHRIVADAADMLAAGANLRTARP